MNLAGSSNNSLIVTKNLQLLYHQLNGGHKKAPNTSLARFQLDHFTAIGRSWILCIPKIAVCGWFKIGVEN